MQPLVALLAATAACALARPPDAIMGVGRHHLHPTDGDAVFKRMILKRYFFVDPHPHPHRPPQLPMLPFVYDSRYDWLNKEIERLNIMNAGDPTDRSSGEKTLGSFEYVSSGLLGRGRDKMENLWGYTHEALPELTVPPSSIASKSQSPKSYNGSERRTREAFALTPFDNGYYDTDENHYQHGDSYNDYAPYEQIMRRRKSSKDVLLGKRPIRQNPNRKNKLLISEHLDKMKSGLPPDTESQTDTARRVFVAETIKPDPTSSLYGVALVAAVAIALTITLIGFALGWYMISKKAKAAADVDYPAYGVTGPTLDCSGDRKLAHSAHMYHYQHQKQQILAMERNGVDQRIGSVSDPESEEENEEGDYTVYECPGFATTGDMEVKNPLFSDDPTPATPGKDAAKKDEKVNKQYKNTKE